MGKYTRKEKFSGEVVDMKVVVAALGVRTRSRALVLQRLQKQDAHGEKEGGGRDYLELRSRRIEKLPPPMVTKKRYGGRKAAATAATPQEEVEASFGDNMLELEAMERETTPCGPCNLISPGTISTPGSTTRPTHSSHSGVQVPVCTITIPKEFNEFMAAANRRQQQAFVDKYNFDPVNECPLPGRYEWVKLD